MTNRPKRAGYAEGVGEQAGPDPTPQAAPAILAGMRVRLRATERWCAGTVQGGSLGTVYFAWMRNALGDARGTLLVPCVRWDRVKAREGYHFAIGMRTDMVLPGWLELISQEGGRG